MNLSDYIRAQGGTAKLSCPVIASVALAANCSPNTLYMIQLGHKQAGPALANAIEVATDGEVSRQELRPDIFGPAAAANDDREAA